MINWFGRFFIEGSLVQHRERRSVWISLECGPCDAKLTFYNRCALKGKLGMVYIVAAVWYISLQRVLACIGLYGLGLNSYFNYINIRQRLIGLSSVDFMNCNSSLSRYVPV